MKNGIKRIVCVIWACMFFAFLKAQECNYTFVDLALPSGNLWASSNLGAFEPYEIGDYYSWGETTPKDVYQNDTYKYFKSSKEYDSDGFEISFSGFTKYVIYEKSESYGYKGFYDNITKLEQADDAVSVSLSNGCITPSSSDFEELYSLCEWQECSMNDVKGYKVTGTNGSYIFLPCGGYLKGSARKRLNVDGCYWASDYRENENSYFRKPHNIDLTYLGSKHKYAGELSGNSDYRVYGLNLRPIKPGYFIETKVFKSTYSEILSKTIETISVDDEESINNVLLAYDALSEKAKTQLQSEKELLDALKQKVDEMIALATAKEEAKQELAAYKDENDYRKAQQVELANAIVASNEAIDAATTIDGVNAALANAKSTIDAIKTDAQLTEEEVAAEVDKFKSAYAGILAKTIETVSVEDKEAIENALSAYSTLTKMAQAQLQAEKDLLDALKQKVDEMIALATVKDNAKQELSAYKDKNDYREAQQVELANAIAAGNATIDAATTIDCVNTALANAKSTIDAIKTDAQLTEEEVAAEVCKFKSAYTGILAKTIETVSVEDKEAIENALSTYSTLSEMAQAQLQTEKELLDALKQKVDDIISGIDFVTIDNAKGNIYTLSGQKVQTVQKGRVYIVDGKKTLIK